MAYIPIPRDIKIDNKKEIGMKSNGLIISEYKESNGSYRIHIANVGLQQDSLDRIKKVIKFFATGSEFFLGHYRTDGINISNEQFIKYGLEIQEYFKENGKYQKIIKGSEKHFLFISECPLELVVCSAPNDEKTVDLMDKIFHYYLETIVFCPKIDWDTFVASYSNYMEHAAKDYVLNGFTDFLFAYVDSGDFSVSIDPKIYDQKVIREQIERIFRQYEYFE